jgi:hypothetical protein
MRSISLVSDFVAELSYSVKTGSIAMCYRFDAVLKEVRLRVKVPLDIKGEFDIAFDIVPMMPEEKYPHRLDVTHQPNKSIEGVNALKSSNN